MTTNTPNPLEAFNAKAAEAQFEIENRRPTKHDFDAAANLRGYFIRRETVEQDGKKPFDVLIFDRVDSAGLVRVSMIAAAGVESSLKRLAEVSGEVKPGDALCVTFTGFYTSDYGTQGRGFEVARIQGAPLYRDMPRAGGTPVRDVPF